MSRAAAQGATLATRKAKDYDVLAKAVTVMLGPGGRTARLSE
jgi:hypothetical protein